MMSFFKKIGALTSKPYAFTARPWELKSTFTYDLFDSVGSNIRVDTRGASVLRVVPHVNESLNENWISDKVRFSYDGLRRQRLINPLVQSRSGSFKQVGWPSLFSSLKGVKNFTDSTFLNRFAGTYENPVHAAQFLFGGFSDVRALSAMASFAKKLNLNQVSLLPSSHLAHYSDFRNYLFETSFPSLEKSDFCLLIACNPRLESPMLNIRLRRSVLSRSLRVASLGFFPSTTYKVHSFGNSFYKLLNTMEGKSVLCSFLKKSLSPTIIFGETFFSSIQPALVNSFIHVIRLRTRAAINSISSKIANLSSLELGLSFCRAGKSSAEFLKISPRHDKSLFWLNEVDHCEFYPSTNNTIVSSHHHGDALVSRSSYAIPGCTYFEKQGSYLSGFGESLATPFIHNPPEGARVEWRVLQHFDSFLNASSSGWLQFSVAPCSHSPKSQFYYEVISRAPFLGLFRSSFSGGFHFFLEDFYMSDSITRNSVVMALSSSRFGGSKSNFLD